MQAHVAAPPIDVRLAPPITRPADEQRTDVQVWRGAGVPAAACLASIGLLLVALAYNAARAGATWADPLFWAGLIVLFGSLAARLLTQSASRTERLALVALVGLGAYLVKVTYSPLLFVFPDEMQHWRTLNDIVQTGTLFTFNPILRVSALYPGLELVTHALVTTTGLSYFWAGLLVVGAARLLFGLALFLFYEQVSRSARAAGVAAMVYMANPNFLYLDGQFGYESLALPLVAVALYAIARQRSTRGWQLGGLVVGGLFAVWSVVITHHFSQFVLAAILAVWALSSLGVFAVTRRSAALREATRVGLMAAICVAAATAWLAGAADTVIGYLGPNFTVGFVQLLELFNGQSTLRVPFRNGAGQQTPLPVQVVGYMSILIALGALPFGLRWLWRRHRLDGAAWALAALAIAFPITLPLRLTPGGVATAGRLPEVLYLGVAFVVALAAVRVRPSLIPTPLWNAGLCGSALILLLGGAFTGWGPPGRLPGPYLISADARSVDAQNLAMADWSRRMLGADNVLAADVYDALVMGSYGDQQPVSVSNTHQDASEVFLAPDLGDVQRAIIQEAQIRYLVVDRRLATGLPLSGIYYEHQEAGAFQHDEPIPLRALTKFDDAEGVSRIFDSGDLSIYDVRGVADAR